MLKWGKWRFFRGKILNISVKNWDFDTLKDKFLLFGCHNPIMQLSSGTAIVSKEITCGHLIDNGIKDN